MVRRSISTVASVMVALGIVFAVPVAQADTGNIIEPQNQPPSANDGWQSANCTSDEPTKCSPETPELYFKQAGGHPQIGFTQYIVQHEVEVPGILEPLDRTARRQDDQNAACGSALRLDGQPAGNG